MSCGPGTSAFTLDAGAPEIGLWADKRAAKLIVDISKDVRASVRLILKESLAKDLSPDQIARLLRNSIGLTERDAAAVMRSQLKMLADGVSPSVATARAERYASQRVRNRTLTIARTESMAASNQGLQELWSQARQRGLLTGKERKRWVAHDPCSLCAPMSGETVPLDGEFSIPGPPAHPNCNCEVELVIVH